MVVAAEPPGEQATFSGTWVKGCSVFLAPQPVESTLVLLGVSLCQFGEAECYWGLFSSLDLTWALDISVLPAASQAAPGSAVGRAE